MNFILFFSILHSKILSNSMGLHKNDEMRSAGAHETARRTELYVELFRERSTSRSRFYEVPFWCPTCKWVAQISLMDCGWTVPCKPFSRVPLILLIRDDGSLSYPPCRREQWVKTGWSYCPAKRRDIPGPCVKFRSWNTPI